MHTSVQQTSKEIPAVHFEHALDGVNAPCAIVDFAGGLRCTTPSFDVLFPPASVPIEETLQQRLRSTIDISSLRIKAGVASYLRESGERVPVVLQAIPFESTGHPCSLVVVTDGAAFRKAEALRFGCTPCPIMRVAPDARITLGNAEALRDFADFEGKLIGRRFVDLFADNQRADIEDRLSESIGQHAPRSLDTSTCGNGHRSARSVHLVITPDFGPDMKPVGALVVVQAAIETIRNEIRTIALGPGATLEKNAAPESAEMPVWKMQFDRIVAQISKLIDFDHVNFGIYAENVTLFKAEALYPDDSPPWPARWMELPQLIDEFIASGETWIADIDAFVAQDSSLLRSEVVRCYKDYGIRSCVTLIVRRGGKPTSALTLCSREPAQYGAADLELLRDLDLEPILLRYEEEIANGRRDFCQRIESILGGDGPLREGARKVVDEIAEHFSWDYAALFRVNRHDQRFELFHQKALHPDLRMPDDYHQPILHGMLASTLEADCVRIVDEIGGSECEQYGYVGGMRGANATRKLRSAMTIPVHLNGRVRWVFDAECETSHAFHGPDEVTLIEVIGSVERRLMHRMLCELKECLLKETDRGVVIVGMEGTIMELNEPAASLLGWNDTLDSNESKKLRDFCANERSREVLDGFVRKSNQRVDLKGARGENNVAIATRVDLDSSFDMAVWFLTDVQDMQWHQNLRFLHETVSDVAQQTRAPLTLASLLTQELPGLTGRAGKSDGTSVKLRHCAEEILAEIGKADMTFERLAEALKIRLRPMRVEEPVNLTHCVADVIDHFPERDRSNVQPSFPDESIRVMGDDGRLTFAVKSILGYLLRLRRDGDAPVTILLARSGSKVRLELTTPAERYGAGPSTPPLSDALTRAAREAREAASLSLDAIRHIVEAHRGTLQTDADQTPQPDGSPRLISFTLTFDAV
jgi:PAS domain-containing protein